MLFTRYLESPSSPIPGIYASIRPLDLRARKTLLSICRCQSMPLPGSKLWLQVLRGYPNYRKKSLLVAGENRVSLSQIVDSLESYIIHPIPNGFLQMVIKTIPLEHDDIMQAIDEGFAKEIVASQERRYTPVTNIRSILSDRKVDRSVPLLRGWITFDPEVHHYIYGKLLSAVSQLTSHPYYPNYGRKLLPDTSRKHFLQLQEVYAYSFEESTLGMEALYSRTGIYPEGPTEMKQSFGYHDLRPRIYFSRGATHYVHSKYIQEVFNRILEVFPCVHKFERFHIRHLSMSNDEIFMVYDFSVFTTNLQSLSEFLHSLGDLYRHIWITIIDTHRGPVRINLGEYLHAYARNCNDHPEFETFYGSKDGEPLRFRSGAGLLGVPGNISSSTLWHAVILMCIIQGLCAKVVGDDAGVVLPPGEPSISLVEALNEFGDVSMPKTEEWRHLDVMAKVELYIWQYVKRPIYRLDNKINCGETPMQFPNPSLFIPGFADVYHSPVLIEDEVLASIRCGNRFVRECARFSLQDQSMEIIEMCRKYHNYILRAARRDDERKEQLQLPRFPFHQDVLDLSFESWYSSLPDLVQIPEIARSEDLPENWVHMKHYRIAMRKPVKLIVDLEYGEAKMITRTVLTKVSEGCLREFYEGRIRPLYLFILYESCPRFLVDLLPTSDSSPNCDGWYYSDPASIPYEEIEEWEDLFM